MLESHDQEKLWQYYCALNANPFSDIQSTTFTEFVDKMKAPAPEQGGSKKKEYGMSSKQIRKQAADAQAVLDSFVPPERGN